MKQVNSNERFQYADICALWANGSDDEAGALLEQAYQREMWVAKNLKNETLRRS